MRSKEEGSIENTTPLRVVVVLTRESKVSFPFQDSAGAGGFKCHRQFGQRSPQHHFVFGSVTMTRTCTVPELSPRALSFGMKYSRPELVTGMFGL
jgi:hypothetical protein